MLINAALDTNKWVQITVPDTGDLTAMQIWGEFSSITIFNIYNDCEHSRIVDALDGYIRLIREY